MKLSSATFCHQPGCSFFRQCYAGFPAPFNFHFRKMLANQLYRLTFDQFS